MVEDPVDDEAATPDPAVLDLLLAEAERDRTGVIATPPEWAAVVSVERVSLVSGVHDPGTLRLLLQGQAEGNVLVEVQRAWARVADTVQRNRMGRSPDAGASHRDAGHHSVTTDAERLRAALRAAHRTFEAEAYYRARYSERGARFAGTVSAWLVTRGDLPADGCLGQVAWLSRVLATRGMPSWLLERHLGDLTAELEAACGAGAAGTLPDAAAQLRSTRVAVVADQELERAPGRLLEESGAPEPLAGAAALVLAAAADVAAGVTGSWAPCVDWLTDADRCDPDAATWLRAEAARIAPDGGVSAGRSRGRSRALRS